MDMIRIDKILPNPEQPRRAFDERDPDSGVSSLDGLAQSIRENGVIQPVIVEQVGDVYILHDGERRVRAARLAGLSEIPAVVTPGLNGNAQEQRLLRALVANIQRQDLSPIETARAYQKMVDLGYSVREIASKTGKAESVIRNRLDLLRYEPEVQELVHAGKLQADPRVCTALMRLPAAQRVELAQKAARRRLSTNTILTAAGVLLSEKATRSPEGQPMSLALAKRRYNKPVSLSKWSAAAVMGKVPPWPAVEKAASKTCRECVLATSATLETCSNCPAVSILEAMIRVVERVKP